MVVYYMTTDTPSRLGRNSIKTILPYIMIFGVFLFQPLASYALERFRFMKYVHYLEHFSEGDTVRLLTTFLLGPISMFILYGKGAKKLFQGSYRYGEDNYFKMNAIFLLACFLSIKFYVIRRIFQYSEYMNIIAVSALPRLVKDKRLRVIVMMTILVVLAIYWQRRYIHIPLGQTVPSSETWPYKSIIF